LRHHYEAPELRERVGLHPNFLSGSTHGNEVASIIDHVHQLWPQARGFRSHSFFDHSHLTLEMRRYGMCYDSNICLWLQPNCVPLAHQSGLVRFPVYWEDDVHLAHNYPFEFCLLRDYFDQPGLKVINIHPIHVALNVPSIEFYQANKQLNKNADRGRWQEAAHRGAGTRTLLIEMLEHVLMRGYHTMFLYDVYKKVTRPQTSGRDSAYAPKPLHVGPASDVVREYQSASTQIRADFVREQYDRRDTKQLYATSRDFHLRELEIGFLLEHLQAGKVLDLGCGNGYTLLSLARNVGADYLGIDFSSKMVEGAADLIDRFKAELKCVPTFVHSDVRKLLLADSTFDCVISERCLLNLPSKDDQFQTIREVYRVLKSGGVYLMVEGTEDGLERLNQVRAPMGLEPIPTVAPDNVSALKFREHDLEDFLQPLFNVEKKHYFGLYYLISRVVHPLLVAPEQPKFDNPINAIARKLTETFPCDIDLGHVVGYKLIAKK
jgi:ubiquinone/menaquinone biosynthesis C-methylase UbiE